MDVVPIQRDVVVIGYTTGRTGRSKLQFDSRWRLEESVVVGGFFVRSALE
jgi:hypothetical protein